MFDNQSVTTMLDSFLEFSREKRASEPTSALNVGSREDGHLRPAVTGQHYAEQSKYTEGYGISDNVEEPEALTDQASEGTVGTGDADDEPLLDPKDKPDENDVFSKTSALHSLGDRILNQLKSKQASTKTVQKAQPQQPANTPNKPVDANTKIANITKTATEDADMYSEFISAYAMGIEKSANEAMVDELMASAEAEGVSPEALAATLGVGAEGGAPVDDLAALNALEQAGISEQDITETPVSDLTAEEVATVNELLEAGLSPEELVTILENAPEEGADATVDDLAMAEALASEMPQEDVDTAIAGAEKIAAAAKLLNINPHDLFVSLFKERG